MTGLVPAPSVNVQNCQLIFCNNASPKSEAITKVVTVICLKIKAVQENYRIYFQQIMAMGLNQSTNQVLGGVIAAECLSKSLLTR